MSTILIILKMATQNWNLWPSCQRSSIQIFFLIAIILL